MDDDFPGQCSPTILKTTGVGHFPEKAPLPSSDGRGNGFRGTFFPEKRAV